MTIFFVEIYDDNLKRVERKSYSSKC